MNGSDSNLISRRILGQVSPHEFVGRTEELERIVAHAAPTNTSRGMLLLMEPSAGVSELLRQAFDRIFSQKSGVFPIYFAFTRSETTAVSAAIEFLNAFLQQYVAYRRNEPELCHSSLNLQDLVELALPIDLEWIEQLVESYKRLRFSNDDKALVRFCLSAPQRVPVRFGRPFVMFDGTQLAEHLNGVVVLGTEVLRVLGKGNFPFVLAGLRRQILEAAHDAELQFEMLDVLRLEQLDAAQARALIENVARRQRVATSEEARDLLAQQFAGSPFFISVYLQAAREKSASLTTYLDCQRLYVDELLGGHIHRHFTNLLEDIVPGLEARNALVRLLWEAIAGDQTVVPFDTCRKRLHLGVEELEDLLHHLHVHEFINWDGLTVETLGGPQAWRDYLKVRYRLDVLGEPRALVLADALTDALKRAPHIMARHYRQLARLGLRELLSRFDTQRVPAVLFDFALFRRNYKGASDKEINSGLDNETNLFRLPQTVHVASCLAFSPEMRQVCEEDRCMVAHAFEEGSYVDAQEVIWLAVEVESKLEVDTDTVEVWCNRLETMADGLSLRRFRIWLISNEGFSDEACELLNKRHAFGSSRRQVDLLAARLGDSRGESALATPEPDEFLVVVPMGEENELIAAGAVEQIANRLKFGREEINQIKTAIVEACINAAEHSLSPDQKIYQRFRVESDKLVVTISSRGIVPTNVGKDSAGLAAQESQDERRGWGLNLIRTLMDEVEFERVDDGTSLRMTKYLRNSSS